MCNFVLVFINLNPKADRFCVKKSHVHCTSLKVISLRKGASISVVVNGLGYNLEFLFKLSS